MQRLGFWLLMGSVVFVIAMLLLGFMQSVNAF